MSWNAIYLIIGTLDQLPKNIKFPIPFIVLRNVCLSQTINFQTLHLSMTYKRAYELANHYPR